MVSTNAKQGTKDSVDAETDSSRSSIRTSWFPILLIAPSILVIALVVIYPVIYSIYVSFTPFHLLRPEQTFVFTAEKMWDNYIKLFNDDVFWRSLRNTVIFLTVTVNLSYFIALALSQLLARVSRGQSAMRTLLMIPMMFAPVLVGFQFAWFFNATVGLVNNDLDVLRLDDDTKSVAHRSTDRNDRHHVGRNLDECSHVNHYSAGRHALITTRDL